MIYLFNLSFHLGGYSYDGAMYALQDDGYTAQYNKSTELRRRWKQPGDITDVPRYVYGQEYGAGGTRHVVFIAQIICA